MVRLYQRHSTGCSRMAVPAHALHSVLLWSGFGTSCTLLHSPLPQRPWVQAQHLLHHDGLFVGSSAAMNCVGAVKVARQLGPGHTIVTVLCDGGHRCGRRSHFVYDRMCTLCTQQCVGRRLALNFAGVHPQAFEQVSQSRVPREIRPQSHIQHVRPELCGALTLRLGCDCQLSFAKQRNTWPADERLKSGTPSQAVLSATTACSFDGDHLRILRQDLVRRTAVGLSLVNIWDACTLVPFGVLEGADESAIWRCQSCVCPQCAQSLSTAFARCPFLLQNSTQPLSCISSNTCQQHIWTTVHARPIPLSASLDCSRLGIVL